MRIGLFGGSFNPPHIGHLYIAEEIKRIMRLDEVVMMPAGNPYLKDPEDIEEKHHRLMMTKLLTIDSINEIAYHDLEIEREDPSYTIDTVKQYKKWHPDGELYLIVGKDAFSEMGLWKEPEQIANLCTIVVVGREEDPLIGFDRIGAYAKPIYSWWENNTDSIIFLDIQKLPVSSTMIRNRIKNHRSWEHLTTANVADYIKMNNLYGYKEI